MKRFRRIVFWCHLLAGAFAAPVILIMSVTGVLLMYEKQLTLWADTRTYRTDAKISDKSLDLKTLLQKVQDSEGTAPTAVTLRSDSRMPVAISIGRERTLYLDRNTGAILGDGSPGVRKFFRSVTDWHRTLAISGNATLGRGITGVCNLVFMFLVVSGAYLWLPRKWSRSAVRNVALFRRGLSGRARDFNWHNVIGVWCALPLAVIVASGVVISYPWASGLLHKMMGETPPVRQGMASRQPERANSNRPGENKTRQNRQKAEFSGIDLVAAIGMQAVPDWRSIAITLQGEGRPTLNVTADAGSGGQPQKRTRLVVNTVTNVVEHSESFQDMTAGNRLRSFMRFAHTGEVGGIIGQSLAGLVSAGGAVLVWTGLALVLRRYRNWRAGIVKAGGLEANPASAGQP